jgi:hypothetical protein
MSHYCFLKFASIKNGRFIFHWHTIGAMSNHIDSDGTLLNSITLSNYLIYEMSSIQRISNHIHFYIVAEPPEWSECYDESTGYHYYWNVRTNEVRWDKPEELLKTTPAQPPVPTSSNPPLPATPAPTASPQPPLPPATTTSRDSNGNPPLPAASVIHMSKSGSKSKEADLNGTK